MDDEECREHEFRDFVFKRPTFCDQCREFIYSPSRAGVKCTRCNANLHPECAHEVIAERRGRFPNDTYVNIGPTDKASDDSPPMRRAPPKPPRMAQSSGPEDEYTMMLAKTLGGIKDDGSVRRDHRPSPQIPKLSTLPVPHRSPPMISSPSEGHQPEPMSAKISFFDFEESGASGSKKDNKSLSIDSVSIKKNKNKRPSFGGHDSRVNSISSQSSIAPEKTKGKKKTNWPKTIESDGHRWSEVYFAHPTFCDGCHQFCWGINKKQGYQCRYCKLKIHRRCYDKPTLSSCNYMRGAAPSIVSQPSITPSTASETPEETSGFTSRFIYGEKILGSGAFGVVMDCTRKGTGEVFAVKIVDTRKFRFQPKFLETLNREIGVMMRLSHPGIVNLIDSFHENNKVEIVMEYVTDGTLQEWMLKNDPARLQESDCQYIFWQLVVALEYLHDLQVTHRDMKPDNILLKRVMDQYPMRTKIVDFGFAKSLDEDMYTETVAGTGAYMAPEIKSQSERGVGYTVLVDMWSVGAVLYHILCGALPFPDPFTPVDRQPLNFPDDPWAEISDDAKDLIRKMLCPADERLTAAACLEHPWMKQDPKLPVFFPVGVRNVDPNL